eukprot:CAMPEP_0118962402 /NCGR_PEP_ID=MMETSP1173-20130426/752_1 /TAXON_ID=1034831 /ORGANISM="Rhizochromulina marina cf, Strain CCMP1243" /LENGTH=103 /DNA_ID=CAMNT_0006910661 /DNA_START=350 /DNA_END=661 /DNA_ORIENTATION=-
MTQMFMFSSRTVTEQWGGAFVWKSRSSRWMRRAAEDLLPVAPRRPRFVARADVLRDFFATFVRFSGSTAPASLGARPKNRASVAADALSTLWRLLTLGAAKNR